jgi:hypothetical protein
MLRSTMPRAPMMLRAPHVALVSALSILGLLALGLGCRGPRDPSTIAKEPLASLDDETLRDLCAFDLQRYRKRLASDLWETPACGRAAIDALARAHADDGGFGGDAFVRACQGRLTDCGLPPSVDPEPIDEVCARVDRAGIERCDATVGELSACLDERIENTRKVHVAVNDKSVCRADDPRVALDERAGPACRKLAEQCPAYARLVPAPKPATR